MPATAAIRTRTKIMLEKTLEVKIIAVKHH